MLQTIVKITPKGLKAINRETLYNANIFIFNNLTVVLTGLKFDIQLLVMKKLVMYVASVYAGLNQ